MQGAKLLDDFREHSVYHIILPAMKHSLLVRHLRLSLSGRYSANHRDHPSR